MERWDGPFDIEEIRATGAYGTVCMARRRDDGLRRLVALKVLRGGLLRASMLTRARDEARLLSRLQHPNIVRVEGLLSFRQRPIVVMEAVEGLSLRQLLAEYPRGLPLDVALECVRRTARALDDSYNGLATDDGRPLHIVHRDIKPGNMLVSIHGELKVVDFGLSRGEFDDRETTTVSTVIGSRGYLAPEVPDLGPPGPEVDVYSLGITLYELVTGRLPVLARVEDEHRAGLEGQLDLLDPQSLNAEHCDWLRAIIGGMCDHDPRVRPDAGQVRRWLEDLQAGAGRSQDLSSFASNVVAPLYRRRERLPPHDHTCWGEVSFLEQEADSGEVVSETLDDARDRSDQQVRRFLSRSDWSEQRRQLKWILATNPEWSAEPFLDVLRRAKRARWWRFWAPTPTDDELALAIDTLKHRISPEVLDVVREFTASAHPGVREAVATVLERSRHVSP